MITLISYHWKMLLNTQWQLMPAFDLSRGCGAVISITFSLNSLMANFYDEKTCGEFPGKSRQIILKTRRTFPYFVFWTGVLAATLASSKSRAIYWRMWSLMGIASIGYMATLHDCIQA